MTIRSLMPVAFLLLLAGCSVGPDYVRPEIGTEVPDDWAGQALEPAPTVTMADALPEPEASLSAGVLLGKRVDLPPDLTEDMNATGTSHLVAAPGRPVTLAAACSCAAVKPTLRVKSLLSRFAPPLRPLMRLPKPWT